MYVACSTLCFAGKSLGETLRTIGEMGFAKADVSIREAGPHLKPSEVVADMARAANHFRNLGGLCVAAFQVELADGLPSSEADTQLSAICRLARISTVPLVSVPAAPLGSPIDAEIARLSSMAVLANAEGIALAVESRIGTLTENPKQALAFCQAVPGLGLTLDPSHYLAGPHAGIGYDELYPYVRHVRLRDTGTNRDQFQVRIGQGKIEYGRIVAQLSRCHYQRSLTVDIHDEPDLPYVVQPEVRKLKYLLESLI